MFTIEYRIYKDNNYYGGYSRNNIIEWSKWEIWEHPVKGYQLICNSIKDVERFKLKLEKNNETNKIKKQFRIINK